ncbi:hypothetical protein [Hymenobacter sp. GOD-10R]
MEYLDHLVVGQPLRMVHQCAFGMLTLESKAVDPRL